MLSYKLHVGRLLIYKYIYMCITIVGIEFIYLKMHKLLQGNIKMQLSIS
jgi:hypothetical protein